MVYVESFTEIAIWSVTVCKECIKPKLYFYAWSKKLDVIFPSWSELQFVILVKSENDY